MLIRRAVAEDWPAVWQILQPVIRAGETYALPRDMAEAAARGYWLGGDRETFVAIADDAVAGTYYIRANQSGGGGHVCNCGYMTASAFAGRGVASAMCAHSLEYAASRGFRAMQFNFVIGTNARAIALWEHFGFATIGRLPSAFEHPRLGFVDALVMYKSF